VLWVTPYESSNLSPSATSKWHRHFEVAEKDDPMRILGSTTLVIFLNERSEFRKILKVTRERSERHLSSSAIRLRSSSYSAIGVTNLEEFYEG
jgi:hypothetical protein